MNAIVVLISLILISQAQGAKVNLIIDTDGVADDTRAISLALQHPDANVIAFTVSHGCATLEQAAANVARTQRANGLTQLIPIYKGAVGPIMAKEKPDDESFFFGKDGLSNLPDAPPKLLKSDFEAHEKEHAALALIRLTKEHPNRTLTLVATGPLTNVALAIKLDPDFSSRLKEMFLMGGNYLGIGNVNSVSSAEYNFHGDPDAAAIVLQELKCNLTIIPWEAFYIEGQKYEKEINYTNHMMYDTVLAKYLLAITTRPRFVSETNGRQYSFMDEIAMASAIDPDHVITQYKFLRGSVELAGKFSRGQVVIDWTEVSWTNDEKVKTADKEKVLGRNRPPLKFVMNYNVHAIDKMMHHATKNPTKTRRQVQPVTEYHRSISTSTNSQKPRFKFDLRNPEVSCDFCLQIFLMMISFIDC